jgi:type VI protein secretion system component VasK
MNENESPSTVTIDRTKLAFLQAEANINRRPLVRHLFGVAKYLGVGALIHAWLLGPTFERDSLWSWAYLFAWPVPLTFWLISTLAIWFFYCAIVSIGCAALWWATVEFVERRGRARRRAADFRQPPRAWDARQ